MLTSLVGEGFSSKSSANTNGTPLWREASTKRGPKYKGSLSRQSAIRPAVQSARVTELATSGNLDEAQKVILESPRHAINVITWNTLLKHLLRTGKYKQTFKMYNEVCPSFIVVSYLNSLLLLFV